MQNASNPGDHHNTRQQRDDRAFQPLLWWIFLGGLLIVIGLGIYSYFYPNVTERFKFWVGTSTQALILTAIVVQIYIYRRQWEAMRTQAGHMENTLAATEKAANAASESATAATDSARILARQKEIMEEQSIAIRQSADAATEGAKAAMLSAETGRLALELSERADVLIDRIKVYGGPALNRDTTFLVRLKNFGRTRAVDMAVQACGTFFEDFDMSEQAWTPAAPLGANATRRIAPLECRTLNEERMNSVNRGEASLFLYVNVKYKDVFDHLHHSRHRGTYNPGNGTFRVDEIESD